jgi:hypothetical protein
MKGYVNGNNTKEVVEYIEARAIEYSKKQNLNH